MNFFSELPSDPGALSVVDRANVQAHGRRGVSGEGAGHGSRRHRQGLHEVMDPTGG